MRATKYAALALLLILSLTFLLHGTLPQVSTGAWTPANNLTEARSGSAAVVLDDGRVLFTGGTGSTGTLASAELFSTDGSMSAAAPMLDPRTHHTAVVLKDGRVLVAGGTTSGDAVTNAAEIYDPAGNSWSAVAGGMTVQRSGHTASLLQDGTVLIAGGQGASGALNSLEIFAPAAGTFAAVTSGMLSTARQAHAAAVLADGRVLIVGGSDGSTSLNSTDIFDPATGSIAAGPAMASARAGLSATTLLGGKVLLAGGNSGSADLSTAEVYDASSNAISATGGLATPRRDHLAFLLPHNNGVLIAGGSSAGAPVASAELFYPWTGAFTATGPMASSRTTAAGAALKQDGYLLVAGGSDGTNPIAGAELYGFATVKTDKADYAPGETVTITGSGWQPGETVSLSFVESPLLDTHGPFTAVADSNGNIANIDFVPDLHDVNVLFYLTATGSVSQAQTTFTDAGSAGNGGGTMVISPLIVAAGTTGNSFTFTFQGVNGKSFGADSPVTVARPPGATWSPFQNSSSLTAGFVSNLANAGGTSCAPSFVSVAASLITIRQTCAGNDQFSFTYSNATAQTASGSATFTTQSSDTSASGGAILTNIAVQPVVTVQAASKLVFVQQPTNTQAGSSITPAVTVQVRDANGDLVNTSTASVTIAIANNPGGGTLGGTATVAAVNGVATFSNLSINKTGTGYTLTTTSGSLTSDTSSAFNITPGPATQLVFGQQPTNTQAGSSITPAVTVRVLDANNNLVTTGTGSTASIAMAIGTNPSGGTLGGTTPVAASGGIATFSNLSINKTGNGYTLTASSGVLSGATSSAFNITPGPASAGTSTVSASPASVTADGTTTSTITGTLKDANGNPVSGKTVTLAKNGGSSTISPASGVSDVNGVVTFTVKDTVAEVTTYTASDTTDSITITQTATVTFTAGTSTAGNSTASASPTSVVADGTSTSTITVTLKDAHNNPVSGKTVTLTQGGATSTISPASGPSNASGVVTFTVKDSTVEAVTYTATDTSDSVTVTQTAIVNFTVGPVTAGTSTVSASPTSVTADGSTTSTITVTLKDASSRAVSGKTVTLSQGAGSSTISAASGPSNASGAVTFTVKDTKAEAVTYTATDSTDTITITQTATVTFTAGAVNAGTSTVSANPTSVVADGTATSTITVTLKDASNNPVSGKVVTLTAGAGSSTITTVSGTTNASGQATFTAKDTKAEAVTYTATDTTDTITITQTATVTFTFGPLHHFAISAIGSPQTAGTAFIISTITAQDANNNTVTTFDGNGFKVNLTSTGALVGSPITTAAFTNGVLSGQSVTITNTGTFTITATGIGGNSGISGISNSFTVNPGAANKLAISQQPSNTTAGSVITPAVKVEVRDANNNLVNIGAGSSASVGIAIGTNPGGGTLGGTTPVSAVGGVATFIDLAINKGGIGYTLVASSGVLAGATSNLFTINNPAPTLASINPTSGNLSQTLKVVLNGTGFITGVSSVSFGPDITVNTTSVDSGIKITANITIGAAAAIGPRSVSVTNSAPGGGTATLTNAFTVNNPATATTVVSSAPLGSTFGQPVTFTATVTSGGGTPTGSVTFYDGACGGIALTGSIGLDGGGQASFFTSALAAGSHLIFACYTPSGIFLASNGSVTQQVSQAEPAVSDTAPSSSTYGQQVTLSVTVTPPNGGTPTGTVTFTFVQNATTYYVCTDGSVTTAPCSVPVTLSGGIYVASVTTNKLPPGLNGVMATYSGDANFQTEAANNVSITVSQADTDTTLMKSVDPSTYGGAVDLTVKVKNHTANSTGAPTGTVALTFKVDPNDQNAQTYYICKDGSIGTIACDAPHEISLSADATDSLGLTAMATVNTSKLPAGLMASSFAYAINASYAGDTNFKPSGPFGLAQTVNQRDITVTASTDTKPYDGTTSSAGVPTITSGTLVPGDTGNFTQSFDNRNAGTGKTLTPAGTVNDGFGGNNYHVTFAPVSTGEIQKLAITVKAVTDSKTYDGNTSSNKTPMVTPPLVSGDTSGFTQSFDTRNVGMGKTLTPAGSVNDGNAGHNYTVTFQNDTTGRIDALAITVTAVTDSKTYDGNTSSNKTPMISPSLVGGDTSGFTQAFDNRNAGLNKLLTPTGTVNDGFGGNNYAVTLTPVNTGVISALPIKVTAVTDVKTYDGNTNSAGVPTIYPALISPDAANFTQAFDNRNAGIGNKTLTPSGSVNDNNNGNNYAVTFYSVHNGTINPLGITVKAVTDSKPYDGNVNSSGVPTIMPALISPDAANFTQTFDNRNAGINKKLTAAGSVNDNNGGNNYTVTFVSVYTGTITALPITVTAVSDTKIYDGNTSSTKSPTINPPLIAPDTSGFTQAFDSKNAGARMLSPAGSANDGNGGNNYSVTLVKANGVINQRPLVVSATGVSRQYDGTKNATVTLSDDRITGDVFVDSYTSASFVDKNVGMSKPVTVTGISISGADAANYTFNTTASATANISQRPLVVSATGVPKVYDGTANATVTLLDDRVAGDVFTDSSTSATFADKNVGMNKPVSVSGITIAGVDAGNYTLSNTTASTTAAISPRPITVTAMSETRIYDGTTSSSKTPNITTGSVAAGDTANFTQAFDSKNVGPRTLTPAGSVSDGNYGHDYLVTFAPASGSITQRPITVTAASDTKTYDGTKNSTGVPAITVGGLAIGDIANFTQMFDSKQAGARMLVPSGAVNDGNGGLNYKVYPVNAAGSISQRALTISATGYNKVYDGTTAATVTLTDNRVAGDSITDLYGSASFSDPNVGIGKPVMVNGISITGPDAVNYTVNTTAYTTASITQAPTAIDFTSTLSQSMVPVKVTLTATVTWPTVIPTIPRTGAVTFIDTNNNATLGTVTLSGSTATLPLNVGTDLAVGTHVIRADYLPDTANLANLSGSSSTPSATPTLTITGPPSGSLYAVNATPPVAFAATYSGAPNATAQWSFDTAAATIGIVSVSGTSITGSYTFTNAGVYGVTLTANDGKGGIAIANTVNSPNAPVGLPAQVVVYDPSAGFVTGGGWINSPAGAYVSNPSLTGKASFGFVSKYQKGANVPTGETEFNYQVANFNFHASVYQWLVVAGSQAQYKGTGTIKGFSGDYSFLLTARDGEIAGGGTSDGFRIKIMDSTGTAVYDNLMGNPDGTGNVQTIDGGSIVIHSAK